LPYHLIRPQSPDGQWDVAHKQRRRVATGTATLQTELQMHVSG
jgi:hypothetical protein